LTVSDAVQPMIRSDSTHGVSERWPVSSDCNASPDVAKARSGSLRQMHHRPASTASFEIPGGPREVSANASAPPRVT